MSNMFDKSRITVGGEFNRWLVPPAAIAIHLCIGMAYGLSVFWLPLSKALGVSQGLSDAVKCPAEGDSFKSYSSPHAIGESQLWSGFLR